MTVIKDTYGRTFKTLRVSLTQQCNFGCLYCTETLPTTNRSLEQESPSHLIQTIEELHKHLQFTTIRLTGGEPTLYKQLLPLVEGVAKLGVRISVTTNGYKLSQLANDLFQAGMTAVNVSLDAVTESTFQNITRTKSLQKVLKGIDAAQAAGLHVKINSVILKSVNEQEILPLFLYAKGKNIPIRYLELMKMGHLFSQDFDRYFYPQAEILNTLRNITDYTEQARKTGSTARYWVTNSGYQFGIIANESAPFCTDCDRLRIDTSGRLYGCLSETKYETMPQPGNDTLLHDALLKTLAHKQPIRFKGSTLQMMGIGG